MSDTTQTPNMGLNLPVVSGEPGPQYAQDINDALTTVDSHDHTPGNGVPVTPSGMNITSDLSFQDNNATVLRSVRYSSTGVPLSSSADIGCTYVSGVDLYYNDTNGNVVRLTQNGATYPGPLVPGMTAGAGISYSTSAQKFTFQSSTASATPAAIDVGPVIVRNLSANAPGVTFSTSGAGASSYALTVPVSLPTSAVLPLVATSAGSVVYQNNPSIWSVTSGSGTYDTPPGTTWLKVIAQGAGAGGSGNSAANTGTSGQGTTFGTYGTAVYLIAGGGDTNNGYAGGLGGVASGGDINASGASSQSVCSNNDAGTYNWFGGTGASSIFGSGGQGGVNGAGNGTNASGNGAGGGGGGGANTTNGYASPGGGAGGRVEKIITNPAATYSYSVGSAGAGGASGTQGGAGGNGTNGIIIVEAH